MPSRKSAADSLAETLNAFVSAYPDIEGWRVAFSGGRDSTALLHALSRISGVAPVIAVHVHHGLHEDADAQAAHCRQVADRWGIEYQLHPIRVPIPSREGLEASARRLRYQALARELTPRSVVLTAHHAADQAETFLLAALKGSGPAGLAAMPAWRRLGRGWLGRPWLTVSAAAIADYVARHRLAWIEDPSNQDTRFDRNFLRREVLPVLSGRFPVERRLSAAAQLQAQTQAVLDDLLDPVLENLIDMALPTADGLDTDGPDTDGLDGDRSIRGGGMPSLDRHGLLAQPALRRVWLLRRFLARLRVPAPRRGPLLEFLRQLAEGSSESSPVLTWDRFGLRTYRGRIHLLRGPTDGRSRRDAAVPKTDIEWPHNASHLVLADGRTLTRDDLHAAGVHQRHRVRVGFRRGGERVALPGGRRSLKSLMQEHGIPPWQRAQIPLIAVDDRWVAVLWTCGPAEENPEGSGDMSSAEENSAD